MQLNIELTSYLAKNKQSGSFEFAGGTIADALVAYGLDLSEIGFVTMDGILIQLDSKVSDGKVYKVYPTIVAG
jgi:hypothetical protein